MQYTWALIFEICTECNLGKDHKDKCPHAHPDRYKFVDTSVPLTDDTIVSLAREAHNNFGFKGYIGFHYYNEPLMAKGRMLRLINRIKSETPRAKFLLWTNGELIGNDCAELACFERAFISNYNRQNFERVKRVIPRVNVLKSTLDGRLDSRGSLSRLSCNRMFAEFIVDYYGNVHICCMDWRGEVKVGNVRQERLSLIVSRWRKIRSRVSGIVMRHDAPEVCRRCTLRSYPRRYRIWRRFCKAIHTCELAEETVAQAD